MAIARGGCQQLFEDPHPERCQMPTEVEHRFVLPSTDGPVEHRTVRCLAGHVLTEVSPPTPVTAVPPLVTVERAPTP